MYYGIVSWFVLIQSCRLNPIKANGSIPGQNDIYVEPEPKLFHSRNPLGFVICNFAAILFQEELR